MRLRPLEAELPWAEPVELFSTVFAEEPLAVWLDGSPMSYIGLGDRLATASVTDGTVTLDGVTRAGEFLDLLRDELAATDVASGEGFRLGWAGWLGYELGKQTLGVPVTRFSDRPDAALIFVDRLLAFDHVARTLTALALTEHGLANLRTRHDRWSSSARAPASTGIEARRAIDTGANDFDTRPRSSGATQPAAVPRSSGAIQPAHATWAHTDAQYLAMIRACQAAIHEGEAYQLCLTTEATVPHAPDPLATYLRLRETSPSHHGGFIRAGQVTLLSASPEQFLSVTPDGIVESKPIKGTRPRGSTAASDSALARELLDSDKERAENLMIVDLMRNDIARVSEVGSVSVPSLLAIESYAHVHQLVSTVRGILRPGLGAVDAVAACFPAGSMTGAPKMRAVEILDALEDRARGVYSGVFGYFGLDGRADLAMVIRSIVIDPQGATIGAGGGITALSVPEEELAEVKLKAAALLAALGVV
ncbi:anthranilate synthase component I family protein [Lacisediminihabitans changchengi]|uniref:Anthranilate synthase component I family protein n=1 Tax=Lacisediminihabitans changchengi TaxID=2787634 RepID=A0A934W3J9_9MICO|nr:anthranilate synthase component I family protein [Lacisediminihabitans changchengi]MBK4346575.1 anthranilate synthase component I family protein [Lacisediminihabitans changchengi]